MKTVVLQTFRTVDVPPWMQRCLASVREWAARRGYAYEFRGDEVFDLCGDAYLAAACGSARTITNLARLEWIRDSLRAGYDRAIWLDADTFVFDPERFSLDVRSGYACGKETWISIRSGRPTVLHGVHNAVLVFAGHHPDLDRMIDLMRYIAATRPIESSLQVGVRLLTGLHAGFRFPLLPAVGMLGPDMIGALASGRSHLPRHFARANGHPIHAANLCWSFQPPSSDDLVAAMDRLERSRGAVINRFLGDGGAGPLLVREPGLAARPLARASLAYRLKRLLPTSLKQAIRGALDRERGARDALVETGAGACQD